MINGKHISEGGGNMSSDEISKNLSVLLKELQERRAGSLIPAEKFKSDNLIGKIEEEVEEVILPGFGTPEEVVVPDQEVTEVTETVDPAQLDLEEVIKEIEEEAANTSEEPSTEIPVEPETTVEPTISLPEEGYTLKNAVTNSNELYFLAAGYPGVGIGDVFEEADNYYEALRFETIDSIEYIVCKMVVADPEEVSIMEDSVEPEESILPDQPISVEETPEADPAEEMPEDVMEESTVVPDQPVIPEMHETKPNPHDPIQKIIARELEEVYGYLPNFTFEAKDNQYNITLESGETITLGKAYIDSQIQE